VESNIFGEKDQQGRDAYNNNNGNNNMYIYILYVYVHICAYMCIYTSGIEL
jgi:hypothetical protein